MPILLKVQWVDQVVPPAQSEPHSRVMHIGGISGNILWKHSQAQAVDSIERNHFSYYFENDAQAVKLRVAQTADGKKFLITHNGNEHPLLSLPSFPPPGARPG